MNKVKSMQHVFIIGCKGIPAKYGGFETFVEKLIQFQKSNNIQYHVACAVKDLPNELTEFEYNGAHCFNIRWKKCGSARAIFYDIDAIRWSIDYVKKNGIKTPIFYVLACRIGPFMAYYKRKIIALGGQFFINPDGHEWRRGKWSVPIQKYWKISEKSMVKYSDLIVCDSKNIENYIQQDYMKYDPKTIYIAYGADTGRSALADDDPKLLSWYTDKGLQEKKYYLVVGRFVQENNFETMIREFMRSRTDKDFAIITTANDKFLNELEGRLHFKSDNRVKFVGTVYETELLKKIRENAYGYFHGHEVGGTNPSLLEALGSTELNLLLDVGFNHEVGEDGAFYWTKEDGNLAKLIGKADNKSVEERIAMGILAKKRISDWYSWDFIVDQYECLFLKDKNK